MPDVDEFGFFVDDTDDEVDFLEVPEDVPEDVPERVEDDDPLWDLDDEFDSEDNRKGTGRGFDSEG